MKENLIENDSLNAFINEAQNLDRKTQEPEIREIATRAENAGDFRQAVIIIEEVLGEWGGAKNLRYKWADSDVAQKHFAKGASELISVPGSKEKLYEIGLAAENAGAVEDAHRIYYEFLLDDKKGHEMLGKVAEKRIAKGRFADGAEIMHSTLGADTNKMIEIAGMAEAAGNFFDAIEIQKDYIEDEAKIKELQKKWAETEVAKGNFFDAAEIFSKMKGRDERAAKITKIAEMALSKGFISEAVRIRESILKDYGSETMQLRSKMEAEQKNEGTNLKI